MAHARGPDLFQRLRAGIGLDGVERVTREGGETFRDSTKALGMKQVERHAGSFRSDGVGDGSVVGQCLDTDRGVHSRPLKNKSRPLWGKRAGLARFLSEMTLIRRSRRRRRRRWKIAHLARHRYGAMIASHHRARRRQGLALI